MHARIVERFDMELPDKTAGDPWFLDWLPRASTHLTAGWECLTVIADRLTETGVDIYTAREYFGGIGAQALMIDKLFEPSYHMVLDHSAAAVEHLRTVQFPRKVYTARADSYAPGWTEAADLVSLDFGDLTAHKAATDTPHAALLDRVFLLEPKAVLLTDIAGARYHLIRAAQERALGQDLPTYRQYLRAFEKYIGERWGYRLIQAYEDRWSTVMALVPDAPGRPFPRIWATPGSPVGLVLS